MSPAAHTTTSTNRDKGPKVLRKAVRHRPAGSNRAAVRPISQDVR